MSNTINVALDQCIGWKRIRALKELGYNIVAMAEDAEPDKVWMNRAFANGALFVISPDLDIPNIIEREQYPMIWIDYPHYNKDLKGDLVSYVDKKIKFKLDFFRGLK